MVGTLARIRFKMRYTAIIGVYDGIDNLGRVVSSLRNQTIPPHEIIVWVNRHPHKDFDLGRHKDSVDNIIMSYKNGGCYTRYTACYTAGTDYIMMLDDDTTPGSKWAEKCINHIKKNPNDIIGSRGIIIKGPSYLPQDIADPLTRPVLNVTPVDIVGHCTFFKRTHVKYMFEYLPTVWENGEDIQFCAEAMRNGHRSVVIPQDSEDSQGLGSTDRTLGARAGRISTKNPSKHMEVRNNCCAVEVNERGWKPLYLR